MSITDELREWAHGPDEGDDWLDRIDEFCDRIDREHRMAMEKVAAEVDESERRGFDQGFASADDWLAQHEDAMAEHGWIRLPVDADGVPIRVGDKIEYMSGGRDIVRFVTFNHGGWLVNERGWEPFTMRHYHAPTVEDVLRECIANVCRSNAQLYQQGRSPLTMEDIDEELDEYINEYAVRLRLAEEVDA